MCYCRFILSVAIVVMALVFLPADWAKWVIVVAGALLAIMSLFYKKCCCRKAPKT